MISHDAIWEILGEFAWEQLASQPAMIGYEVPVVFS
jgi:hypothetical protein